MNYTQKERFIDRLCGAGLMLIFIEIIFAIIDSSYRSNFNYHNVNMWIYIGGGVLLASAIALLVSAYIKKNSSNVCYGIELLVMAFSIAMLPGCYIFFPQPISKIRIIFPILFVIYYIGKAVYIFMHRNDTINSKNSNKKKR